MKVNFLAVLGNFHLIKKAESFGQAFSKACEFLRQSLKSTSAEVETYPLRFKQTTPRRLFGRSKIFPLGEIFAPSLLLLANFVQFILERNKFHGIPWVGHRSEKVERAAVVDIEVVADGDRERAGAVFAEEGDVRFLAVDFAIEGEAIGRKGHRALADVAAHYAVLLRVTIGHADSAVGGQGRGEIKGV